jgi:OPA family glycerol-3-phosphate transporter-like MFS transporter/OPA family sugar phosphate sensor protein UhpC-like MFS transporter
MIGYAVFYFVRKNFSFAIPGLSAEFGITKTSFGIIMTIIGLVYGASRFLNGFMADRLNARFYMATGLFLCSVANFAFGFGTDISWLITGQKSGPEFTNMLVMVFGILLIINNLFQGTGFPPCARLLTHWIPPKELATKMSIWNTSHSIGASLTAIMCGYIMGNMGKDMSGNPAMVAKIAANLGIDPSNAEGMRHVMESAAHVGAWRWCFWIPAAIALCGSIFLLINLRDTPKSVGLPEIEGTDTKKSESESDVAEHRRLLRDKVFGNKLIWILGIANLFVYIVRFSILDWGPTFLKEARGLSLVNAGWTVAIFEIFGIMGMLAAGWFTDKYMKGLAHRTCVFCMLGAAAFMTIFYFLPAHTPFGIIIVVLAMAGFFIYGPQALIGISAANQATKNAAATANGLTGIFGYSSVLITGVGVGALVDSINRIHPGHGWNTVFLLMIAAAIVGSAIFMLMWEAPRDGYEKQPAAKK